MWIFQRKSTIWNSTTSVQLSTQRNAKRKGNCSNALTLPFPHIHNFINLWLELTGISCILTCQKNQTSDETTHQCKYNEGLIKDLSGIYCIEKNQLWWKPEETNECKCSDGFV